MKRFQVIVPPDQAHERLDKFLAHHLKELSRSRIQSLIENGHVHLTPFRSPGPSLKIKEGDLINVSIPPLEEAVPQPKQIPLDIIYEDQDVLVLNKAAGIVVHPAPGHYDDTLVNALLAHCGDSLSGIGGVKRPGIVHRLDKETTGLMVIAKHDLAHQGLTNQFIDRSLSRLYVALVWGLPSPSHGTICAPLGRHPHHRQKMAVLIKQGREAITTYHTLHHYEGAGDVTTGLTLVECKLQTGRTHQIRVHFHHIGHPLLGDPLYGHTPKKAIKIWPSSVLSFPRQALHAKTIQFYHPMTQEFMTFTCDLPSDFQTLLTHLDHHPNKVNAK